MTKIETIDVVVITYNSAAFIGDCLDALRDQKLAQFHVIVVDNDSSDETLDIVANHPIGAQMLKSGGNLGYSAAINLGVAVSSADAVLVLNPDTRMRPRSVDALREALEQTGASIAAPKILNTSGEVDLTIRRFPSASRLLGQSTLGALRAGRWAKLSDHVTDTYAYEHRGVHDWCSGAALLISRSCLDTVGEWDEAFFLYSEETDFCWRANNQGFETVFEPTAVVEHIGGESGTSPRLWSMLVQNRIVVVRRHRGRWPGMAYWVVSLLTEGVRSKRQRNRRAAVDLLLRRRDPAVVAAQTRARSQALRY